MKFFIDSANLASIEWAKEMGMLDGVTTNPSLMAKEPMKPEELYKEILKVCEGPVSIEVISDLKDSMVEEGEKYAKWGKNVVIKVPLTEDGLKAIKIFSDKGIKTNATLIFSANQALLAAKAGATFVSPFIGRLDDKGERGMDVVDDILKIFRNYDFKTEVLVASIRGLDHVKEAALSGAGYATIPPKIITELSKHELTDSGLKKFMEDWKSIKG